MFSRVFRVFRVFRDPGKGHFLRTLLSRLFRSGGPTHHFGRKPAKRCPESDQKVTFSGHFRRQEKTEKTRKVTISRLFSFFSDSGGPSLHLWPKPAQKQQKTAENSVFSAVFAARGCLRHAQWPGHAFGDTFDASFQKSKMTSEDDIHVIERSIAR